MAKLDERLLHHVLELLDVNEAGAFAALIVYVTAVHAVLYSEARYALPAKPVVLLLATVAVSQFRTPQITESR